MAVIQTNKWTCDVCQATEQVEIETSAYSDPVVTPPTGWDYDERGDDLCPKCLADKKAKA
jgi:hypothetical protein